MSQQYYQINQMIGTFQNHRIPKTSNKTIKKQDGQAQLNISMLALQSNMNRFSHDFPKQSEEYGKYRWKRWFSGFNNNKSKGYSRQLQSIDRQVEENKSIVLTDFILTTKTDPLKHKKGANILQLDLKLDDESKMDCLHSRKRNSNPSILKNKSRKLSQHLQNQKPSIDGILSTRCFKPLAINERQQSPPLKKRQKMGHRYRKIVTLDASDSKRLSKNWGKFENEQYRKFFQQNIQLAKTAFLSKNKHSIKIYRPWSPVKNEEGFPQFQLQSLN